MTLEDFREMTNDLPDETPVVLVVRCHASPDHFHDDATLEAISVDLLAGVVQLSEVWCRESDGDCPVDPA